MKPLTLFVATTLCVCLGTPVAAEVIENTQVTFQAIPDPDPFLTHTLELFYTADREQSHCATLVDSGDTVSGFAQCLAVPGEFYHVGFRDPLRVESLAGMPPFPRFTEHVGLGEFYVGFAISEGFDAPDAVGWIHFLNTADGLEMLGNAVSYNDLGVGHPSPGVIVGTAIALPEPSLGICGGLFAVLVLGSCRRRRIGGILPPSWSAATYRRFP